MMKFYDIFTKVFGAFSRMIGFIVGKFEKMISNGDGKPKMGHTNFKRFGMVAVVTFVASMFIYRATRPSFGESDSLEKYRRELAETDGVKPRNIEVDGASISLKSEYGKLDNGYNRSATGTPGGVGESSSPQASIVKKTKEDCLLVMDDLTRMESLTLTQKEDVKQCAKENPMGWDKTRVEAINQSVNENLSPQDKSAALDVVSGKKPERGTLIDTSRRLIEEPELSLKSLTKSGVHVTPEQVESLSRKIADLERPQQETIKKIVSSSVTIPVPEEEAKKIKTEINKAPQESSNSATAQNVEQQGNKVSQSTQSQKESSEPKDSISGNKKAIRKAADDLIKNREQLIKAEDELRDAQLGAKKSSEKSASGKALDQDDIEKLKRLTAASEKVRELKQINEAKKAEFLALKKELSSILGDITSVEEEIVVGGYLGEEKIRKDGVVKKDDSKDPSKVNPQEEVRKKTAEEIVLNISDEEDGGPKRIVKDEKMKFSVDQSFITVADRDDRISISPASKFLAVIGKMEIASNQSSQQIRGILMTNIYDAKTGKVAIPKRSVLLAKTGVFNEETGKMDVMFTQAIVGSRRIDVSLRVGSADGSIGLNGDIYDTRKRKLLAAWIGSFMSGVTGWFSEAVLREYQSTKDMQTALLGAALGGAKDVADKQTQVVVSDLQNAPTIFKLPENTPVVLYPE